MRKGDEGYEAMLNVIVDEMTKHGPMIDVPLAEKIVNSLIDTAGGDDHIAFVGTEGELTMAHPIVERFRLLPMVECPTFRHFIDNPLSFFEAPEEPGRYRVVIDTAGRVTGYERME